MEALGDKRQNLRLSHGEFICEKWPLVHFVFVLYPWLLGQNPTQHVTMTVQGRMAAQEVKYLSGKPDDLNLISGTLKVKNNKNKSWVHTSVTPALIASGMFREKSHPQACGSATLTIKSFRDKRHPALKTKWKAKFEPPKSCLLTSTHTVIHMHTCT